MDKRTRDLVTEAAIKVLVPRGWKGLARSRPFDVAELRQILFYPPFQPCSLLCGI